MSVARLAQVTEGRASEAAGGVVRIIGGQWRRKRLHFETSATLRPTPDRIRETLFNWLHVRVQDCACLDLCAGSGALCLEALSRGARSAVAVDNDRRVVASLQQSGAVLGANLEVVCADACAFLEKDSRHFGVVFADAPYHDVALRQRLLARLHLRGDGMWLYWEAATGGDVRAEPLTGSQSVEVAAASDAAGVAGAAEGDIGDTTGEVDMHINAPTFAPGPGMWHTHRECVYGGVRFGLYRPISTASPIVDNDDSAVQRRGPTTAR